MLREVIRIRSRVARGIRSCSFVTKLPMRDHVPSSFSSQNQSMPAIELTEDPTMEDVAMKEENEEEQSFSVEEDGSGPVSVLTSKSKSTHRTAGMESSVLRFKDVNFVAGTKKNPKQILSDVTGSVKWGRE